VLVKQDWELALMRNAGQRLAEVVAEVGEIIRPGTTTRSLDRRCEEAIRRRGARPAFKGYRVGSRAYPAAICASRNEVVLHGLPDSRPLCEGDLLSVDLGLFYGGYCADMAFSVAVGNVPPEVRHLLDVTEQSLYVGIAVAVPGNRIGDIGHAIQSFVQPHGLAIVRGYAGHGIGRSLHELPSVPNRGVPRRGMRLEVGMCLAVEPMVTMGGPETKVHEDGWSVVTRDGSLAAHFEHTLAITPRGPEILTVMEGSSPHA